MSHIPPTARLRQSMRWRTVSAQLLTPSRLRQQLAAFEAGSLREAVSVWEWIEQRDDMVKAVVSKRRKSVARHGWEILPMPGGDADDAPVRRQIETLRTFYSSLRCTHALDENEQGGFKTLVRQMMDAVGKRYAVHEILWDGKGGAEFRFVPLGFFENTTGRLRFLRNDSDSQGMNLEQGRWLVTAGDGLMMATSAAWLYKHTAMERWIDFVQRNGTPGLHATTNAVHESEDWKALVEAVEHILEGGSVVTSPSDNIKVLDLAGNSAIPFPALVERIDRLIAALWRGADLSTLSRDRGYGASLQEREACLLEEEDTEWITETLNRQVDKLVLQRAFGADVTPLARVRVLAAPRECTPQDMQVDEFLLRSGAPLAVAEVLERYGRPMPRQGEALLRNPAAEAMAHSNGIHKETSGPALDLAHPLANDATGIKAQTSDWVQLSPFGEFPHAGGVQRITEQSAREMALGFSSLKSRLGRLFGGAPFYAGHPDLPGGADADTQVYGWIQALEARADGLYGQVDWTKAGDALMTEGRFKSLSPFWRARRVGTREGRPVYQPFELISAGLTNEPNLPVTPLVPDRPAAPRTPEAQAEVPATAGL